MQTTCPAKLAFGDHMVDTSSASKTLTVTNVGTANGNLREILNRAPTGCRFPELGRYWEHGVPQRTPTS
jgi:hypothetical protein